MGNFGKYWLGMVVTGLLTACAQSEPGGLDSTDELGQVTLPLATSCVTDADCATAGYVCSPTNACVRPQSCVAGATGAGIIPGPLVIDAVDTVVDMQALGGAWCVTGNVSIKGTALTDLTGLSGLVAVGGTLSLEDNTVLRSLHGFENLRKVFQLSMLRNTAVESLSALSRLKLLSALQIYGHPTLSNLNGFQGVTNISWAEVVNNAGLTSLEGLGNVASVYSYLDVRLNPRLVDLHGLEGVASVGNLVQIMDNPTLTSLSGLGNVTQIGSTLRVWRNPRLESLDALGKLARARTFAVADNPLLNSCNVTELATRVAADCSGCLRNGSCPPPDNCPTDPAKLEPGVCGCNVADVDTDGDGALDCVDPCPADNPDDSDGDTVCNGADACPGADDLVDVDDNDTPDGCQACVTTADCDDGNACTADTCAVTACNNTVTEGQSCGALGSCSASGVCVEPPPDNCPNDPSKLEPGACGCGLPDVDTDGDGVLDCVDPCPRDRPDDSDGDGVCNGVDACAGANDHLDVDGNGIPDGCQACVTAEQCNDGNPCTTDSCAVTSCQHTVAQGQSCGNQGSCSAGGECVEPRCQFKPLGFLPNTARRESTAFAVSADGRTVTGRAALRNGSYSAFRWTEATGMVDVRYGTVSGRGISADGSVIVGLGGSETNQNTWAFRTIPYVSSLSPWSELWDVSDDGRVAVGQKDGYAMYINRDSSYPVTIGRNWLSTAWAVSADGSVIVGQSRVSTQDAEAFVYKNGAMIGLGDFAANSYVGSTALDVSPDGNIVVGKANIPGPNAPWGGFKWTEAGGMVQLGKNFEPKAVTNSGMIIGNWGLAYVLGSSLGDGDLRSLLQQCGLDMSGWNLMAQDVTPDGKTIVGEGTHLANFERQAVLIRLP
jgi:probable HAF family extracellular repeat protein